jgi:hypothetical protein
MATNNKKTTTKKEVSKTSIDLETLQNKMAEMLALNAQLQAQIKELQADKNSIITSVHTVSTSDDVTIVYCSDSLGYASISGLELHFTRYGEEFVISRSQFDQLVGKYRRWFDEGILAVSYKNIDVAAAKGLKTDKEIGLDAKTLFSIGDMSASQLENLWNSLNLESQKQSVLSYVKRKFIEGDSKFMVREKIDLLNRLTNGGFTREQDELSGRYKINPTIM